METRNDLWRPLGALLVESGLIQEAELEQALEEQRRRGGKLGEVLVELGLVPAGTLKAVLLQQCGLDLSQQDGFGSGLRGQLERRAVDVPAPAPWVPPFLQNGGGAENGGTEERTPRRRRLLTRKRSAARPDPRLAALCNALDQRAQSIENDLDEVRRILNELVTRTSVAAELSAEPRREPLPS